MEVEDKEGRDRRRSVCRPERKRPTMESGEFQKRARFSKTHRRRFLREGEERGTGWGERKPRRRVRRFIKETPESLPAAVRNPETVKKIAYPLSPSWRMCTVVANFNADAVRSCKYRLAGRRRSLEGPSLLARPLRVLITIKHPRANWQL